MIWKSAEPIAVTLMPDLTAFFDKYSTVPLSRYPVSAPATPPTPVRQP